jgi:quercetin dioxygenase-like cupin family protein
MGYYHRWEEFPQKGVSYLHGLPNTEGIKVRIMSTERMMMTQVQVSGGGKIPRHYHEAEQLMIIQKGKARVSTGKCKEFKDLGPGDIWVVPANELHGVEYVGDCEALEIVSPPRPDNFSEYVMKHTFFEEE